MLIVKFYLGNQELLILLGTGKHFNTIVFVVFLLFVLFPIFI